MDTPVTPRRQGTDALQSFNQYWSLPEAPIRRHVNETFEESTGTFEFNLTPGREGYLNVLSEIRSLVRHKNELKKR
jgi:hypothetical protein